MNQMVKNPFQQTAVSEALPNTMTEVKSQREASEIQAMVFMAKQFPRNQIQAADRILNACTRQTLADSAVYSYPRGGQNIEGPSIRLAEVLAQNWGNLDFGIRELSQENGVSTVEAYAWDLETTDRPARHLRDGSESRQPTFTRLYLEYHSGRHRGGSIGAMLCYAGGERRGNT